MEGEVRIFGKITDVDGHFISGAEVTVKDSGFHDIAKGKSNEMGDYELFIQEGQYSALCADAEHGIRFLPYWEWNFCPMEDSEINITLDRIELYAINAFIPQGTFPQFMIYFRPMSLTKTLIYKKGPKFTKGEIIPVSPDLGINDVEVFINEEKVKVFTLSKVEEFSGDFKLAGYFMTTQRPMNMPMDNYSVIRIKVNDKDNQETGEGVVYW